MRKLRTVLAWIVISIVFQLLFLAFADMVYLPGRKGNVEIVKYAELGELNTGGEVKIPEGAVQVKLSFDASYASYMLDGKLIIVNVKSGEADTVLGDGFIIDFYKWLPDRNMVIYSARQKAKSSGSISVETYDADAGVIRAYPEITDLNDDSHVVDIQLSTLTNLVYVKVAVGQARAEIYRYNIMEELSHVMTLGPDTTIRLLYYSDILLYQRGGSNIMLMHGSNGEAEELDSGDSIFLGSDMEDVIYLGELDEKGNVKRIRYGTLQEIQDGEYSHADIAIQCLPEQVDITRDGGIYLNESDRNLVHDLKRNVKIEYRGNYVGVVDKHLVTLDDDVLNIEPI